METQETHLYTLFSKPKGIVLCTVKFNVREYKSECGKIHKVRIKVEHDSMFPLVEQFKFDVYNGKVTNHTLIDFVLPYAVRGNRIGTFIMHMVYNLIPVSIRNLKPRISGRLHKEDQSFNRDTLWRSVIGHPKCKESKFRVSKCGDGNFSGLFYDVGRSWSETLVVRKGQTIKIRSD